ncbi:restriction endonuclease subunit S [Microbacterium binotii]|uniref:Type I restriction modification DNA specificity domain-containing protein n=1 Tax=Microbacterium binotii TaxID=462710 RepID=A0ABN3P871_9MICO
MTGDSADRWAKTNFGRLARIGNGADYSSVEVEEGGYPVYGSGGVFRRASSYLFDGESVLFGRKGTVDRPLYVDGKFWTVDTMFYSVIDRSRLLPRFAYYWATTLPFGAWATDTALPSMTSIAIKAAPIALPPLPEQRAIADYLDRETAQIDAFIAKNEELITLLTERRVAATFRLVTGLDVTEVPYKSVNADWLRVVPQTWDVAPLYTMANTFAGGTPKSDADEYWTDDDDDGVEWIAIGDMRAVQAGYSHGGRRVTTAGLEAAGLTPRSGPLVLFAMYASVGEVAMLRHPAVWNQAILGIRANPSRLNERYLYWSLLALRPKLGIYFRSNTQDNLNAAQVRGLRLPVPPLDEQLAIADQLEETWASVDEAIATAQRGVELARERRAALISAAVTGKIDVGVAA